jgi:hypothetical protein
MCKKGNCPFSNFKIFKYIQIDNLRKDTTEIETGMAEKSSWDQANKTAKTWFGLEK